jgi:2,4-dienoyl-CoA reductase (NADPH2)
VDPATGHELDAPDLVEAGDDRVEAGELPGGAVGGGQVAGGDPAEPPDLVVVGGGPGGLETARAAAAAGLSVRLVERGPVVGGMLDVVAQLPGRSRFADLAEWYRRECERLGVEVRTGVEVSADDVAGWRAAGSRVVEAVGGTDGAVGAPVAAGARCWTPSEVLVGGADVLPPGDVLVWDPVGGPVGVGVAELLAAAGRTVHLATQDFIVGNELARSGDLAPANSRLATAGVVFHRRSVLREVTPVGATIEDRFSARRSSLEVAAVVDAGHRLPGALGGVGTAGSNGTGSPVHRGDRVGDAVAPRTVLEAVLEGRRAVLVR